MGGAELYAGNTAEMWANLAPWTRVASGAAPGVLVVHIPARQATRIILRQPLTAGLVPESRAGEPALTAARSQGAHADRCRRAG
jgi:hypothetical protein